jgi:hypothetical protein
MDWRKGFVIPFGTDNPMGPVGVVAGGGIEFTGEMLRENGLVPTVGERPSWA